MILKIEMITIIINLDLMSMSISRKNISQLLIRTNSILIEIREEMRNRIPHTQKVKIPRRATNIRDSRTMPNLVFQT